MWVERLPRLYDPGPEVTVDEQLLAFRGRCPFKQYMPSKPAKYGIKSWVACDAKSSYAWKMQVYTGKAADGAPEQNQGRRVVLDVTAGLRDRNVTCDNFFTSYELGRDLMTTRNMTMVGTVRKSRTELLSELVATKGRRVLSSQFAFTPTTTLVSYVAKKNKNVLLMSTRHTDAEISDRSDCKPTIVLDYNRNKVVISLSDIKARLTSKDKYLQAVNELYARRSEERRVGKECLRLCRSRWSPYH